MPHRLRIAEIVDRDDLEIAASLEMCAEEVASDPPETVDPHPCLGHGSSLNEVLQRGANVNAEGASQESHTAFAPGVHFGVVSSYSESGGSALVRRRIQTPSDATVLRVVPPGGGGVLGASPPARPRAQQSGGPLGRGPGGPRRE